MMYLVAKKFEGFGFAAESVNLSQAAFYGELMIFAEHASATVLVVFYASHAAVNGRNFLIQSMFPIPQMY